MVKPTNPILDEIATVEKDIYQDYIGKTLLNPDKILKSESGGRGVEIYEDLLRDDKVGSTLQTRKLAVVGKEWEVIPASEKRADQKVADYVKEVLLGFDFDAARRALLSGLVIGFKPAEVMWNYSEGQVWVKEIMGRASRRFVFDTSRRLRLLTLSNMIAGEELPDRKFMVYTNVSDNGSPYGDGLGRILYWPVWFKKNAIKFWMVFADKFGSPTVIGKYPSGTTKAKQDELLDAIDAIQQEAAIKIPDNMVIELLEATRSGSITTYDALTGFMNRAIAQVILGQTLTSEIGDKGSYAASQTHEDVRQDYLKADADSLCLCINNSLIRWIVDYNYPAVSAYPKVWIRTEPEADLKPLVDRDSILVSQIGLPVTKKYFYDTYGIPEPKKGEELVERPQAVLQAPMDDGRLSSGLSSEGLWPKGETLVKGGGTRDEENKKKNEFAEGGTLTGLVTAQREIDSLTDQALAAGVIDSTAIGRAVDEAQSYEDLQTKLAEAYQGIDITAFRNILAQAMFMADLKGRTLS